MNVFLPADILIPDVESMEKWSVIACDQFSSQPEYWKDVKETVGDAPSSFHLILPEAEFLGEEEDCRIDRNAEYIFVVDPIDGTTNFIKDYHMSCVSVGLIRNGKRYLGVVHNPYLDETFSAISGEGAYMNGNAIHVSSDDLENGVVLFGSSPYNTELAKASFELAYEYFQKCLDIRRSGSAALDLCSIASGRAELYFELILSPWDFAAGALIVEEAGGIVTTVEGGALPCLEKSSVLARNK